MGKVKTKRIPIRKNDYDNNPTNESGRSTNNGGNNYAKASQGKAKHLELANDAMRSGDRVTAERHLQHADHFHRIISAHKSTEIRPVRKYPTNDQIEEPQTPSQKPNDVPSEE